MPAADASEKQPATSNSPNERRTLQSSSRSQSTGNRLSIASTETGESSRSASTRASTLLDIVAAGENDVSREDERHASSTINPRRTSHRNRQSRSSGGFLLSNTALGLTPSNEHTSRHGTSTNRRSDGTRDHKGKSVKDETKPQKRKSGIGLGVVGSPLASNITNSGTGEGIGDGGAVLRNRDATKKDVSKDSQGSSTGLDIDSAQIVNLALNLSEHRKLATRRNIATPIPPSTPGFEEALAGGSLKYHLQQQRRSSRNISPKPEKPDRAHNSSPRLITPGQRTNSGFRGSMSGHQEDEYHYYFSPSTLARAEKARNSIELMAQYRRLLQYVPPLRPTTTSPVQPFPTPPETSSNSPASTTLASSRPVSAASNRPLGRPYNPLQYIRNRRVRARLRKNIDGESEGFGDINKVKAWVDQISSESVQQAYGISDVVPIPRFPGAEMTTNDSSYESPQSSLGKNVNAGKYKRPRMDWMFTPEDLLADLHWLEQGENKKCIEDRDGRKIFPQKDPLKRPMSRESNEPEHESIEPIIKAEDSLSDHRVDAELPKFRSIKSDTARGRARQKLHDTIHGHHRHSGSFSESHRKTRSESDSSGSEDESRFRRVGRSRSREPPEPGRSLLEKQMMELMAKEARESEEASASRSTGGDSIMQSIEPQTPLKDRAATSNSAGSSIYSSKLARQKSHRNTNSREFVSGRASLEVPHTRTSLEGFDSTAPNSPLAKASNPGGYIPSINLNISPAPSRESSPSRKPLQRVRSKINKLRDRSRQPGNELDGLGRSSIDEDKSRNTNEAIDTPASPEARRRSISPTKGLLQSRTGSSGKSFEREGSMRRKKGEDDSSGLRGLFKGGRDIVRGPVSQMKDFIWKKDASPGSVDSSTSSSEDSPDEAIAVKKSHKKRSRKVAAKESYDQESTPEVILPPKSYLNDMPSFNAPAERRDRTRPAPLKNRDTLPPPQEGDHITHQRRALSLSRSPRFDLLKPPRIDIQTASPSSSPDFAPVRQISQDSDVSDIESRRNSYTGPGGVLGADARLNAVLGLPGHPRVGLPVTALAGTSFEKGTHNHSHSHGENDNGARRPRLGSRQWSISDRAPSNPRGPITKREIARVRALLLSSGVKAREIARREEEIIDIRDPSKSTLSDIATTMIPEKDKLAMVPRYQEHALAARILSTDMQLSSRLWQSSASQLSTNTVPEFTSRIHSLKDVTENLTAMCRTSADEADALGRDLVGEKTMAVKRLTDAMEMMQRRRRRRFRWVRRGGWVMLEWVLVGVMWWVWLIVVLIRIVRGLGGAVIGGLRWLFWL